MSAHNYQALIRKTALSLAFCLCRVFASNMVSAACEDSTGAGMALLKSKLPAVSLTVLPVRLLERTDAQVARAVALLLERTGVERIEVPDSGFTDGGSPEITGLYQPLGEYVRRSFIQTEYVLYAEFIGTPRTGAKEIRGLLFDRSGNLIWSDSRGPGDKLFDSIKPGDPMTCAYLLVESLRGRLDLPDPARKDMPEGRWSAFWNKASGIPPKKELDEIKSRQTGLAEKLKSAKVEIMPVLVNNRADSTTTANLAGLINRADICLAKVSNQPAQFSFEPSPDQQKILWELAGKLREYLRKEEIKSEYVLLCSYMIDPSESEAHGADFILCDSKGDWVIVDLQNEHWKDFQTVSPRSVKDCNRLVVKRLAGYLGKH